MTMILKQVRLPKALVENLGLLVKQGEYASESDLMRDAIRQFVLWKLQGSGRILSDEDRKKKEEELESKDSSYIFGKFGLDYSHSPKH